MLLSTLIVFPSTLVVHLTHPYKSGALTHNAIQVQLEISPIIGYFSSLPLTMPSLSLALYPKGHASVGRVQIYKDTLLPSRISKNQLKCELELAQIKTRSLKLIL